MNIDDTYADLLEEIQYFGKRKANRTGTDTISISGAMIEHSMEDGFPLITTKKMAWKTIRVELEGFIKGVTSKEWYKERGCNIWNEWCNQKKVPYGHSEAAQMAMYAEDDLGPIYGYQWRNFNGTYEPDNMKDILNGIDQLGISIDKLKNNPNCRRNIVMAWNPQQLDQMALVPCHYSFQLLANDGVVDLLWNQRSVDVPLGLPFNIASYALLLELIAKECNMKAGKLIGFLADVHIYVDQMEGIKEQLTRKPFPAPTLKLGDYDSIFNWDWSKASLENYKFHDAIKMPVAI